MGNALDVLDWLKVAGVVRQAHHERVQAGLAVFESLLAELSLRVQFPDAHDQPETPKPLILSLSKDRPLWENGVITPGVNCL